MSGIFIVTGSRIWKAWNVIYDVLDRCQPELVVHGACEGPDLMAEAWAKARQVDYLGMPAKWGERPNVDRSAGHKRNRQMLLEHPGAPVLAFPLGEARGTRNCIETAVELGHRVWVYDDEGRLIQRLGSRGSAGSPESPR